MEAKLRSRSNSLKFTRTHDDSTYVFVRDEDDSRETWTRTDRNDIKIFRCSDSDAKKWYTCAADTFGGKWFNEKSDSYWYVATTADPNTRLGIPGPTGDGPDCVTCDSGAAVTFASPPTGLWLSQKKLEDGSIKKYEYTLEYIDGGDPTVPQKNEEYETQARLRNWESMLSILFEKYSATNSKNARPDAKESPCTFYDLGCGAGAVSRLLMLDPKFQGKCRKLIAVDMDPSMIAHTYHNLRDGGANTDNFSLRLADMMSLTDSRYPSSSWPKSASTIAWTSFCTAYFHPAIADTLRHWAESLLEPGGLMCIVEICGLFSAHGYSSNSVELDPIQVEDVDLFQQADDNIVRMLNNDVYAGKKLAAMIENDKDLSSLLEIIHQSEWDDGELAFSGAASEACLEQWRKRLLRPGIQKTTAGLADGSFAEKFLKCLKSPAHCTRNKVKMIILKRKQT